MKVDIPRAVLLSAMNALLEKAHNDAAHSQAPDLFTKEDTQEWHDAQFLKHLLTQHR